MFRLTDRQVKHRKYIVLLLLATTFIVFSWRFLLRDTINIQSGYLFLNSKNSDADISIVIQGESSIVCVSKVFPDLYSKIFSQVSHVDRIVISHGAMSHKDYLLINKQSPKDLFLFSVLTGYENMEYLEWSMLFNQDESFLEERFNCFTQLTGNASIEGLCLEGCSIDKHVAKTIGTMKNIHTLSIAFSRGNTFPLCDAIQNLKELPKLKNLELCDNDINQKDLDAIAELKGLEMLNLNKSDIKGDFNNIVQKLKKLKVICIVGAKLDPSTKKYFDKIKIIENEMDFYNEERVQALMTTTVF